MNRLVIGCGYLGSRVATAWQAAGDVVHCVTRSEQRSAEFKRNGWRSIVADVTRPDTLTDLPEVHTVLFGVARGRQGVASVHALYVDGLRAVLDALPPSTGSIVLISSTGVYAQDDGSWVDESSECQPQREGGRACLAAEQLLVTHPRGRTATVLRLAGLYGPGRIPRRDDLLAGRVVADPGDGYLNLIHIEDAAAAIVAAAAQQSDQRLYNVSDGNPGLRREYLAEVARCLGAPAPQFVKPTLALSSSGRGSTDKRVSNRKLIDELGVALRYPSYREGLRAIVATGG